MRLEEKKKKVNKSKYKQVQHRCRYWKCVCLCSRKTPVSDEV